MENNEASIGIQLIQEELSRKVFGNSLLLTEMSKKLDSRDLFKTRLVSKLWREIASGLALSRPNIRCLPLVYDTDDKKYRTSHQNERGEKTKQPPKYLQELNLLIDTKLENWKFPCGAFSFKQMNGHLESSDFLDFFRLCGKNVRCLQITLNFDIPDILSGFKNVLLTGAPNIKTLELEIYGCVKDPVADPETGKIPPVFLPQGAILPNLEIFKMHCGEGQILTEILKAAVNLKEYIGYPPSLPLPVENLIEAGKIHCVRHLSLYTSSYKVEKLELLSRSPGLQLTTLELRNQVDSTLTGQLIQKHIQIADSLSRILESSKSSLKKIKIRQGSHLFNRRVFWPHLEKCTVLEVENGLHSVEEAAKSSSCFLKAQVFPNLHKITLHPLSHFLEIGLDAELNPDSNFKPMSTVCHLEIRRRFPSGHWAQNILRVFPNVETLIVEEILNFPRIAQCVWDFSKLKRLGLGLACGVSYAVNSFPSLEASFTGLSENVVQKIRSGNMSTEEIAAIKPVGKSILDLTELEHFRLRFVHHTHELTECYDLLSAEVTGELAFKRMEKTRIEIGTWLINEKKNVEDWKLKMGSALKPMTPYAKWFLNNEQKHSGWFLE